MTAGTEGSASPAPPAPKRTPEEIYAQISEHRGQTFEIDRSDPEWMQRIMAYRERSAELWDELHAAVTDDLDTPMWAYGALCVARADARDSVDEWRRGMARAQRERAAREDEVSKVVEERFGPPSSEDLARWGGL